MSESNSFTPFLFAAMLVGVISAFNGVFGMLEDAKNIQSPDVIIDDEASERLREQITALFPPEDASDTLKGATIILLPESDSHPFLLARSGGMVYCSDPASKSYVVTVPSKITSFEVGFNAVGNATARVPKHVKDQTINDAFPVLQQAFKTLSRSCEMKAAFAAEFGDQTYPLHSGLSDVVFSSEETIHVHVRASFDLSGKVTKLSSHHTTLEGRSAAESAKLVHELISTGI